jgi:hypothetical protein
MDIYDQINHAMDTKARIEEYLVELENMQTDISPSDVVNRINSIFNKAEDARFELKCRQGDLS